MPSHTKMLEKCKLQRGDYLHLLIPAIDWSIAHAANRIGVTALIAGHNNSHIEKKYFQHMDIFVHLIVQRHII